MLAITTGMRPLSLLASGSARGRGVTPPLRDPRLALLPLVLRPGRATGRRHARLWPDSHAEGTVSYGDRDTHEGVRGRVDHHHGVAAIDGHVGVVDGRVYSHAARIGPDE